MLRGISPLISPELLMLLADMGHGESLLLADANFPAGKYCRKVLHLPGTDIQQLLAAILPLWVLDYKRPPLIMPECTISPGNRDLAEQYLELARQTVPKVPFPEFLQGDNFYREAMETRVCVVTGDLRRFANLIIRKGVFTLET